MDSNRYEKLESWLSQNNYDVSSLRVLSGDASFRKYYRVDKDAVSYVVMDCPPDKENLDAFIKISDKLQKAKINVPKLFECNEDDGFLVISDLGDNLYSKKLDKETVYCLYTDALETIVKMQMNTDLSGLDNFDNLYDEENKLFTDWFLQHHQKIDLDNSLKSDLSNEFDKINSIIKDIPKTFVHRDFHSRNLLVTDINNPGIIDYQDAVLGPVTYDLVSLLKDCYITWDDGLVEDMLDSFFTRIKSNSINSISDFRYWFDITGLQRHIKAIGIFSRLNYRDNKDGYLKDIPRTYAYVDKVLNKYKDLSNLNEIFNSLEIANKL
ncbi:MAG: phosphotransferase [Gammaproteobacteria bacterium]|jgi:aminoglycoside/choline kinase family phosphotransferase